MLFFLRRIRRSGCGALPAPAASPRRGSRAKMDLAATVAAEFEFFVFDETPHSVREKGYRNLKISRRAGSAIRCCDHRRVGFHHALLKLCDDMDMPLEAFIPRPGLAFWKRRLNIPTHWRRQIAR